MTKLISCHYCTFVRVVPTRDGSPVHVSWQRQTGHHGAEDHGAVGGSDGGDNDTRVFSSSVTYVVKMSHPIYVLGWPGKSVGDWTLLQPPQQQAIVASPV